MFGLARWLTRQPAAVVGIVAWACLAVSAVGTARAEVKDLTLGGFSVHQSVTVPGDPATIYDAMTGDISGWWDHTFSGKPKRFVIEAKPGGGFYEIFDDSGDGVLHGTVIYAQRGKILRFRGPLGLSGNALDLVCTWTYQAKGDSTVVDLVANAAGQMDKGWPQVVDQVWHHFMVEGFKPYIEAGKHKTRPARSSGKE
jgi:hypothetical protein